MLGVFTSMLSSSKCVPVPPGVLRVSGVLSDLLTGLALSELEKVGTLDINQALHFQIT